MQYAVKHVSRRGVPDEYYPQWRRGENRPWVTYAAFDGPWGLPGHELPCVSEEQALTWLRNRTRQVDQRYQGLLESAQ